MHGVDERPRILVQGIPGEALDVLERVIQEEEFGPVGAEHPEHFPRRPREFRQARVRLVAPFSRGISTKRRTDANNSPMPTATVPFERPATHTRCRY